MAEPLVFDELGDAALEAVSEALTDGEAIVFPTDTVYGLAARPEVAAATSRLFDIKARPRDLTLPVLLPDAGSLDSVADPDERARKLAERFWPGPLTLVLPRSERSKSWDLGEATDSIAVRVPNHPVALEILGSSGPLATTSANLSGEPTPSDCAGVRAMLGDAVAVYVCAGSSPAGTASTVFSLTGEEPTVLREGALSEAALRSAL